MGRQDLGKANTFQHRNTCATMGDKGRQGETRLREGDHTIQHRHTCGETRGDKTSGRRTHHPTQAHMWGDNGRQGETRRDKGRQGETRPREGGHTIQHSHPCVEIMETKGEGETRGDKTLGRRAHHPTQAHMCGGSGRQGEARGDKTSGRRTRHPTQADICGETMGDKGKQDLGKADTPSNTKADTLRKH